METEIRGTILAGLDAWAANDADAFAGVYTEDATVALHGGVSLSGREEIRAYMAKGFAGPFKGSRSCDEAESIRVHGDTATVVSLSGVVMPGQAAAAPEHLRRATWTLVRQDGR